MKKNLRLFQKNKKLKVQKKALIFAIVGAIAIFLAFNPYFVWQLPIAASGIACVIMCGLSLINCKTKKTIFLPMLLLTILYIIMAFHSDLSLMGFIAVIMICPLFFASDPFINSVYKYFTLFYSCAIGVSLIVYILVVFLNINLPHTQIDPLVEEKKWVTYYVYPFLVYVENSGFLNFRFHGLFDEPGVVGTISGAIMLTERFNLKKIKNIPIFLSGLFSLSLFFLLVTIVYVAIRSSMVKKISIVLLLLASFAVLRQNEVLDTLVFDRLEFSDGFLAGDNRNHMSEVWYKNFSKSSAYWWGLGGGSHAIHNPGGASYKDLIIDYGVIFFITYVLALIWASLRIIKRRSDVVLYIIILLSVLYQRPFLGNISYTFIMFAPLFVFSQNTSGENLWTTKRDNDVSKLES